MECIKIQLRQTWTPSGMQGAKTKGEDDGIDDATAGAAILETPVEFTLSKSDTPLVIMNGNMFMLSQSRSELFLHKLSATFSLGIIIGCVRHPIFLVNP